MTQHINLLRQQHQVPPSLRWGAAGVLALGLAFLGHGLWLARGNAETKARVLQQEAELVSLRAQVAQAGLRSASLTELQADIARLTPLARSYEGLLAQVNSGRLGRPGGYLEHFTTLTRTVSPQVWVTQVSVNDAGRKFSLQGQAVDASSVLDYVDRLNRAYAAAGLAMLTLDMNVPTTAPASTAAAAALPPGSQTVSFRLN